MGDMPIEPPFMPFPVKLSEIKEPLNYTASPATLQSFVSVRVGTRESSHFDLAGRMWPEIPEVPSDLSCGINKVLTLQAV
jgi:hypothetical protein